MAHEIVGQHGDVAAPLDFRIQHLVALDLHLAGDWSVHLLHRRKTIHAPLLHGIEVRDLGSVRLKVACRISLAPAVERGALENDDGVLLAITDVVSLKAGDDQHSRDERDDAYFSHGWPPCTLRTCVATRAPFQKRIPTDNGMRK